MKYTYRLATIEDLDTILELIQSRIDWMDEMHIRQWNTTRYMKRYPKGYFIEHIRLKEFYLFSKDDEIVGVVAMFHEDSRWHHDQRFFYIRHLTTSLHHSGVGSYILKQCEEIALLHHKLGLRLDCQQENNKLNNYYKTLGYRFIEGVIDGVYIGNKYEKVL